MTATWTEAFSSFTPAGTGWQNYDLYTNKSVPKGAVAYIICANGNDTTDIFMGVRTDGSSLERRINLHEAEDGGYTVYGMYVTCDASTGYIETYVDSTTDAIFYLMGYWTGAPFTERWDSFSGKTASAWNQFTCDSSFPASCAVQTVIISKAAAASRTMGCRSGDSTTNRQFTFHEAEGTDADACEPITWMVKLNASKEFGAFIHVIADNPVYVTGYFDPSYLNYVETARAGVNVASANEWVDWDISASLDQDGRVLDCYVLHKNHAAEVDMGFRKNGSSLARYIQNHEAEHTSSKYYTGYFVPTETDTSGIVEAYTSDATNEWMGMWGYYVPITHYDRSTTDAVDLSESITITKNIIVTDSIGFADDKTLTKGIVVTDTIGAVDATPMSKLLVTTDALSLSEAVALVKSILEGDSLTATDAVALVKGIVVTDTLSASDAVAMVKELAVSDAITVSDAVQMVKVLLVSDTIGASDAVQLVKALLTSDTLAASDSVTLGKDVVVTDAISLDDAELLVKVIIITDAIGLSDEAVREIISSLTEFVVTDSISVSDSTVLGKAIVVPDTLTMSEAVSLIKTLITSDSVSLSDTTLLEKALVATDLISVSDAAVLSKVLLIADSITLSDAVVLSKAMKVADAIALNESAALNKALVVEESITASDAAVMVKSILVADGITLSDAATQALISLIHLRITSLRGRKDAAALSGRKGGESLSGVKESRAVSGTVGKGTLDGKMRKEELKG